MPWKQWQTGDPITINRIVWDGLESEYMQDVLERDWFGPGKYAQILQGQLSNFTGIPHAQLTNSGTSALLIAATILQNMGYWKKGDLILHPGCTFPAPSNVIVQAGMVPVYVDVEEGTYNIDAKLVAQAIEKYPEIKGAIIPHLLGNSPDMDALLEALNGRPLIEDCCDTLGSLWGDQHVGNLGDLAAFSFYGSHHVTTAGVGGALLTKFPEMLQMATSLTFWGREYVKTDDLYSEFKQRYTYDTIGYDMQMSEIQAAFGVGQMHRLEEGNEGRAGQFADTHEFMREWEDWLVLPRSHSKADPSWFGYPICVKKEAPFSREPLARHLLNNSIEIRPMFAGNITRQPAYAKVPYVIASDLPQADRNLSSGLFLPAWGGMTGQMTGRLFEVIEEFMGRW